MANGIVINPNQPRPVVLASKHCPPPEWPLDSDDWVVLPTVPKGFPTGPFPPQSMGPISDGEFEPLPPCPGTGLVSEESEEDQDITIGELRARRRERREEREERREERREGREGRREEREEGREERREHRRE